MGLMDKFKNMFTEEVEEEIEVKVTKPVEVVKKEVIQVEIPAPVKKDVVEIRKEEILEEIKKEENEPIKEVEKPEFTKREEKFQHPVFFDDDEFEDLKPKQIKEVKEEKESRPYQGALAEVKKPEPVKKFKPTPVISPIYGVLDKNYKKDDIGGKKENREYDKPLSIDDIRNKAYGTLADDLENSLEINDRLEYQRKEEFKREEKDYFDDIESFYKGEETSSDDSLRGFYDEEYTDKDLLASASEESDLFDLIDSMYRKDED